MLQWTCLRLQFLHLNAIQSLSLCTLLWRWVPCGTVISRSESNFSGGVNYMLGLRLFHNGAVPRWQAKQLSNSPGCAQKAASRSPSYVVRHNTIHTVRLVYSFYRTFFW
ncbi:hypothetical protein SORBI_3008G052450 [Sorghum bicolor]|uniref:Uncharacterized protein n=1 Tax=Sorghum bicolor TaxID=4558 RepID=A0A1Z5R5S8_SORBI|nr:hypothetical protein SORBI_3008G052450 [Sorghum bicolor]